MKYTEKCEYCGHIKVAYTLNLNKPMANAFIKFVEKYQKSGKALKKGEIGLTTNQYSNFHNMRYHGIIKQYEKGEKWYPTEKGLKFYYGEISILMPSGFMAGDALPDDHKAWDTHKKKRQPKVISEIEDTHYKQRPEYQEEKSQQEILNI